MRHTIDLKHYWLSAAVAMLQKSKRMSKLPKADGAFEYL